MIKFSILIQGEDDISGEITIRPGKNKKYEHTGIRVELIGHIGIKDIIIIIIYYNNIKSFIFNRVTL